MEPLATTIEEGWESEGGQGEDTVGVVCGVVGGAEICHLVDDGCGGVSPIMLKELWVPLLGLPCLGLRLWWQSLWKRQWWGGVNAYIA
jgi:hypothetical protein